jgi:hypothetical protein
MGKWTNVHVNKSRTRESDIESLSRDSVSWSHEVQLVISANKETERVAPDVKQEVIARTPSESGGSSRVEMHVWNSANRIIVEQKLQVKYAQ